MQSFLTFSLFQVLIFVNICCWDLDALPTLQPRDVINRAEALTVAFLPTFPSGSFVETRCTHVVRHCFRSNSSSAIPLLTEGFEALI